MTAAVSHFDDPHSARDRLSFTLFLAGVFHVILILGVGWTANELRPPQRSLDVTLARHSSEKAPDDADFKAQANQIGSGTGEKKQELTTTEMADFQDNVIREIQPKEQTSRSQPEKRSQRHQVTTQGQSNQQALRQMEETLPKDQRKQDTSISLLQRNLEIASLQAKLDAKKQEIAKRPRKKTLTAASTKRAVEAEYMDNWRRKVEQVGNKNYPTQLNVYGDLVLLVAIKADGTIHEVEVRRSSGNRRLDAAAKRIVRRAAPFQQFPPDIRRTTDILQIIRTWKFEPGDYLSSY